MINVYFSTVLYIKIGCSLIENHTIYCFEILKSPQHIVYSSLSETALSFYKVMDLKSISNSLKIYTFILSTKVYTLGAL